MRDESPGEAPDFLYRLASPTMGEAEVDAVRRVLSSGWLTNGPATRQFERDFAERHEVEHAVALANGTVALAAIYLGLGIGPGDEVIVPSLTFISSATSIVHVGAQPVFADVDPERFNLDPVDVTRCLSPKTRAILAVHYGGQPADMDELRAVADDAGVFLIEDAAEAHGATYHGRSVGGLGHAGMFSFTPTKNITMGEGGMVTTSDSHLAERIRLLRNHGQTSPYEHTVMGYNWRMSEVQAAMGSVQLGRLGGIIATKRRNAEWMRHRLRSVTGVTTPAAPDDREHTYMLYSLLVEHGRDEILSELQTQSIEARLYFPPAHRQPIFCGEQRHLPVTDWLAEHLLSLPFHSKLNSDDLSYMVNSLEDSLGRRVSPMAHD
ncbi:MAG TPA: DegT/DnrJ/EryC1/StrS family aminotransferase [Acidimicrobiales bacterium]|nr:DegT/DnrJ/EryC1/StrS family aminotransferase [Acidimicrobiales bacterium]